RRRPAWSTADPRTLRGARRPFLGVLLPLRAAGFDLAEVEEVVAHLGPGAAVLPEHARRLVDVLLAVHRVALQRILGALDEQLLDRRLRAGAREHAAPGVDLLLDDAARALELGD